MAATYHSIIKTVKTQGRFAWDYLENFRIYIALKEGTMNILNIFLGSSKDLMYARKHIGNIIRRLNDQWMEKGVRIRLCVWEDFRTEYEDKSKQQEYIDELVLPSHICIFLYDNRINPYTQKELNAKIGQDLSAVTVYHIPNKDGVWNEAVDVDTMLKNQNITPNDVSNINDIDALIESLVSRYIVGKGWDNGSAVTMETKYLYTTIPWDLSKEVDAYEDAVRSIDGIAQEFLSIRLVLHPKKDIHLLEQTDHYIPLLKEKVSESDLVEFAKAQELQHANPDKRPVISLFTRGAIFKSEVNAEFARLIEGKDLFSVRVNPPYDTVKWRLLCWLLRVKTNFIASVDMTCFQFKNHFLYYFGKPVVSLTEFDPSGDADKISEELEAKKEEIVGKGVSMDKSEIVELQNLLSEKQFLECKLKMVVVKVTNQWLLESIQFKAEEVANLDSKCFGHKLALQENMLDNTIEQARAILDSWKEALDALNKEEDELEGQLLEVNREKARTIANQIKDICLKKEKLIKNLVEKKQMPPVELLATQIYIVGLFDTFIKETAQPQEEDELYFRIFKDADTFGYLSPQVEMARLNYGNAFSRKKDHKDAYECYIKAIRNLGCFPDNNVMLRHLKTHAYISAIQTLLDIDFRQNTIWRLLKDLQQMLESWKSAGYDCIAEEGAYYAALIRSTTSDFASSHEMVEEAEKVFEEAGSGSRVPVNHEFYHEVLCYLPANIAGYYIDKFEEWGYKTEAGSYIKKCNILCERTIENALRLQKEDRLMSMEMQGRAYHQLGFLAANLPSNYWMQAKDYYAKAYNLRLQILRISNAASDAASLAETAVNIGALYLQMVKVDLFCNCNANVIDVFSITMRYAETAVNIYQKLMHHGEEESELCYYRAIQLKGSIIYQYAECGYPTANKSEGIRLL